MSAAVVGERRRLGHDLDLLGRPADRQAHVDADVGVHVDLDVLLEIGLEPRARRAQLVGAGHEVPEGVIAGVGRLPPQLHAGGGVLENQLRVRDHRAGRVQHLAGDGAVEALGLPGDGDEDSQHDEERQRNYERFPHRGLLS